MKILVVEDDRTIAQTLELLLNRQNYAVDLAGDGEAALQMAAAFEYDLVLLDVVLPKVDGIQVCQALRSQGLQMPILLLTGQGATHQEAIALNAGADGYVVKPFDGEELLAQVQALLRRGSSSQPILTWGDLSLEPSCRRVTYGMHFLSLTPKEYAILELLLRHPQTVFSARAILDQAWRAIDSLGEEAVRVHIKELRQKLTAVGAPKNWIKTVYRVGYQLNPLYSSTVADQAPRPPMPPNAAELAAVNEELQVTLEQLRSTQAELQQKNQELQAARDELEQRVADRTAELQVLYDQAPCGYHSLDAEGRIVQINETELRMFGHAREEMIGRKITDFYAPEGLQTFEESYPKFLQRGWVNDLEFTIIRKDGSRLPVSVSATAMKDEAGKFLMSRSIMVDIRDRKRLEADRERREANAAFLADISETCSRLSSAEEIVQAVGEKVGAYLKVVACNFCEIDEVRDQVIYFGCWQAAGEPPLLSRICLSEQVGEEFCRRARAGETIVSNNTQTNPVTCAEANVSIGALSFITVPFHDNGDWKYLFSIHDNQPRTWQDNEIELVQELANRLFPRLERARAETIMASNLRDTQRLRDLSTQLTTETDIQVLYDEILATAIALMHADMGSLQILDRSQNELHLQTCRGFHPDAAAFWQRVKIDDGSVCSTAFTRGERVIVPDVETCDFLAGTATLRFHRLCGIKAVQSTPLMSRSGQLIGMFSTHWCQPYQPSDRELQFLDLLARQAADLIEQWQVEATLQHQLQREQTLADIAQDIRQSLNLNTVLSRTVERVRTLLQVDRVIVFRFRPDWQGDVITESVGAEWTPILSTTISDPCFSDRYIEPYCQGHISTLSDLDQASLEPCYVELLQQFQVKANLAVPILQGDTLWGLLIAHSCAAPRLWHPDEIVLMRRLATQVGIAIQQSELYEQTQQELVEREQIQAVLEESEARFRSLSAAAPIGICQTNADGICLYTNTRWQEMSGLSFEDSLGNGWLQAIHPDDREMLFTDWEAYMNNESQGLPEFRLLTPQGETRWMSAQVATMKAATGDILGYVSTTEDITDRKQAEADLRESQQQLQAILDHSPAVIYLIDLENRHVLVNRSYATLLSTTPENLVGKSIYEVWLREVADEFAAHNRTVIDTNQLLQLEEVAPHPDRQLHTYLTVKFPLSDATGTPYAVCGISTDITEQKQLEAQFLRAQRLESLGTLASGIAHDLNNILTPMLVTTQILPRNLPPLSEQSQKLLAMLEENAKRAADLVKQILTFTRGLGGERAPVQVKHLLREIEQVMRSTFPKSLTITLNIATRDLWLVSADAT